MKKREIPEQELLERGYRALIRELGPDGMMKFICHVRCGKVDYTRDRHLWLDQLGFDEVCGSIMRRQKAAKTTKRRRQRPQK